MIGPRRLALSQPKKYLASSFFVCDGAKNVNGRNNIGKDMLPYQTVGLIGKLETSHKCVKKYPKELLYVI